MTQRDSILIAHGLPDRADRIGRAFAAAGHRVRHALQGAAALEIALSDPPRLIVVHADLPLVDAAQLTEILRANPKTRGVRLLVLGRESRRAALAHLGDDWLDESADDALLVARATLLLERQARIAKLDAEANGASPIAGSLLDLTPADLLQMLHTRRASGTLDFTLGEPAGSSSDSRDRARVRFRAGEIQGVAHGETRGEKALYRLLDARAGEFRFEPGPVDETGELRLPTRTLLAEGRRQLEEWHRIAPRLPALDAPIRLRVARAELPQVLHPVTRDVLAQIETASRVADVVEACSQPDYQILRTLQTLAERGIVELGRFRIAPPEPLAHALFGEAQTRRLRGFVQPERRADGAIPNAKLLVVGASPEATRRFTELLAKVPGAELARAAASAGRSEGTTASGRALAPLGRLAVDGDFAIDLIGLPLDAAFAPIWRFAAHRALGTIFLLDAQMGTSASALSDVAASLSDDPAARLFHVVLLGPGERVSAEEIRRNLSLIDSASLFLLPFDPTKDASSLLRSLFARIVP